MAYTSLFQNEKWWSHSQWSYGYISMEYSHWRDGTSQWYQINYSAGVSSGAYYKDGIDISVILDGVTYQIGDNVGTNNSGSWYGEGSKQFEIKNKTSGNTSFYAAVHNAKTGVLLWAGGETNLAVDNAYPVITTNPSVTARTINSLTFNIGGANIGSDVYYSLDNSSWTHATSENIKISNLAAGTTYTIYVQYRNHADNKLATTATCQGTTLPQASISSPNNNFSINSDNSISVSCKNESGCSVKFFLETVNTSTNQGTRRYTTGATTNTSYTFSNTQILSLLQYAPNSNSLKIRVGVGTLVDGTNESYWSFVDGTLNVINSNPTFASTQWTYQDVNSKTLALTGNNQIVVKGYSSIRGVITSANKAIAKNYATMKKYQLSIGNQTPEESDYSSSNTVNVGDLTAINNVFSMYAIDSRTNSTLAQKTLSSSNYKEYFDIEIDTSKTNATRKDKVGTETTLNVEGKIWNSNFGKVKNSIRTFTVEYKLTSQTDEHYVLLNVNKPILSGNVFKLNTTIPGDLDADGFTATDSFNIRIKITDELSPSTYVMTLGSGTPGLAIHKNGIAINQPYDVNHKSILQLPNGTSIGIGEIEVLKSVKSAGTRLAANKNLIAFYPNGFSDATGIMTLNTEGNLSVHGNIASSKSITGSNLSVAGALNGISFDDVGAGKNLNKSFIGSVNVDGTWYNLINIRHRNGATDGDSYGLQIRNELTDPKNRLYVRSQYGSASSWSEWESIYTAKSLFDNPSGNNGSITLSESAGNFLYLEVFYSTNRGNQLSFSSQKIYNPNGRDINLNAVVKDAGQDVMYMESSLYNIGGVSMVWRAKGSSHNYANNVGYYGDNTIYIFKVIGYR